VDAGGDVHIYNIIGVLSAVLLFVCRGMLLQVASATFPWPGNIANVPT